LNKKDTSEGAMAKRDSLEEALFGEDSLEEDLFEKDPQEEALFDKDSSEEGTYTGDSPEDDEEEENVPAVPTRVLKEFLSWVILLVAAYALAHVVTNYIIVKAEVPSGSMENTIMTKDRIVGNRLAYLFTSPKRGDIIIFPFPDDEEQTFVKRIIGLPGETVVINGNNIAIYKDDVLVYESLNEPYLREEMDYRVSRSFEVPDDSYFMLGDNRNSSNDSRSWTNKFVERKKIIAKVWFRYMSNKKYSLKYYKRIKY